MGGSHSGLDCAELHKGWLWIWSACGSMRRRRSTCGAVCVCVDEGLLGAQEWEQNVQLLIPSMELRCMMCVCHSKRVRSLWALRAQRIIECVSSRWIRVLQERLRLCELHVSCWRMAEAIWEESPVEPKGTRRRTAREREGERELKWTTQKNKGREIRLRRMRVRLSSLRHSKLERSMERMIMHKREKREWQTESEKICNKDRWKSGEWYTKRWWRALEKERVRGVLREEKRGIMAGKKEQWREEQSAGSENGDDWVIIGWGWEEGREDWKARKRITDSKKRKRERCNKRASVLWEKSRDTAEKSDRARERKQQDLLKDSVFLLSHLSPVLSISTAVDQQVPASTPTAHTSRPDHHHQPPAPGWAGRWSRNLAERPPREPYHAAENNMAGCRERAENISCVLLPFRGLQELHLKRYQKELLHLFQCTVLVFTGVYCMVTIQLATNSWRKWNKWLPKSQMCSSSSPVAYKLRFYTTY